MPKGSARAGSHPGRRAPLPRGSGPTSSSSGKGKPETAATEARRAVRFSPRLYDAVCGPAVGAEYAWGSCEPLSSTAPPSSLASAAERGPSPSLSARDARQPRPAQLGSRQGAGDTARRLGGFGPARGWPHKRIRSPERRAILVSEGAGQGVLTCPLYLVPGWPWCLIAAESLRWSAPLSTPWEVEAEPAR